MTGSKARIETMYLDKLDGRITGEFFDQRWPLGAASRMGCWARSRISRRPRRRPIEQAIDTCA